ncbi:MAG: hypothetical protein HXY48_01010 [Ignavibacteriaceae bacterium]|nr:hypothetical protein [Ignavibacteriaceae bacterium]
MFIHNKIIFTIASIWYLLFTGCVASYAPDNWLPDTQDVPQNVYGGWITVITEPGSLNQDEQWMQYSGEFISYDESKIYLLYDSLYQIPKSKISISTLELDQKNATTYGLWVFLGTISTLSHGYYASITAPLWLLFGIPSAVGESARDRYESEYPDDAYWESIKKFSRFPQGVSDIDLSSIKPVFNFQELK